MDRKTIDAMHEIRLMFVQVVIPVGLAAYYAHKKGVFKKIKEDIRNHRQEKKGVVINFDEYMDINT